MFTFVMDSNNQNDTNQCWLALKHRIFPFKITEAQSREFNLELESLRSKTNNFLLTQPKRQWFLEEGLLDIARLIINCVILQSLKQPTVVSNKWPPPLLSAPPDIIVLGYRSMLLKWPI